MGNTNKVLKEIIRFQTDRGLDKQEYSYWNECANIVEELLEGNGLEVSKDNRAKLSDHWREFVDTLKKEGIATVNHSCVPEHESVDYLNDIIVFAIGGICKQGYSPEKTLAETAKEINSRKGMLIDGKFQKYTTEEYTSKWHKADYSKCLLSSKDDLYKVTADSVGDAIGLSFDKAEELAQRYEEDGRTNINILLIG